MICAISNYLCRSILDAIGEHDKSVSIKPAPASAHTSNKFKQAANVAKIMKSIQNTYLYYHSLFTYI
jgi:hypothetical protein